MSQMVTVVVFIMVTALCAIPVIILILMKKFPVDLPNTDYTEMLAVPIPIPIILTILVHCIIKCYLYRKRINRLGETLKKWNM